MRRLPFISTRGSLFSHLVYGLICSLVTLLALTGYLPFVGAADSKTNGSAANKVASPPTAMPLAAPVVQASLQNGAGAQGAELQPVLHARNAAVTACLPTVSALSRLTIDAQHTAISTWNKADANDRMFESIVALKYDSQYAPHGLSVMMASPNPAHKCDGATVQVQPSALSCESIQKNLTQSPNQVTDLNGLTLVQSDPSMRIVLVPTPGNGCAVVGIGAFYAK